MEDQQLFTKLNENPHVKEALKFKFTIPQCPTQINSELLHLIKTERYDQVMLTLSNEVERLFSIYFNMRFLRDPITHQNQYGNTVYTYNIMYTLTDFDPDQGNEIMDIINRPIFNLFSSFVQLINSREPEFIRYGFEISNFSFSFTYTDRPKRTDVRINRELENANDFFLHRGH